MVACGQAAHRLYETGASLVVEVLSLSADVDRREKAVAYCELPELRQLLLVHPDIRRIEMADPAEGSIHRWAAFGPGDIVGTAYGDIVIDALYDAVDRTATTPQLG